MDDCRQRNSPDSSTNEETKPSMTNNNHISGGATSQAEAAKGRPASKNLTLGYKCPKGCKTIFVDESMFAGHLLSEHNVKLVVTAPPQEQHQLQQVEGSQTNTTTPSPLSSLSSPSSTPPTMAAASSTPAYNVITKCPVCRLQVDDLPYHFATAHSTTNKSPNNHDRSEPANNNNVLLNRRSYNVTNGARPTNAEQQWTTSQVSPRQAPPLVLVQNDAIKSEVLSYEEMECGMEADHGVPLKHESPSKRKIPTPARVLPIFLPSQPLPPNQLTIEEGSNLSSRRNGGQSPRLKNQDVDRHVRNLPVTMIPTVVENSHQLTSSLNMNGRTHSMEGLQDGGNTIIN